ncbi:MAG TPA: GNAT family N-acetyltransferase [Pyrinomonadaceae bacterium]|nr:GNAT family N-acetyltransferase [Pyrinomonadaceae bacterium]
MIIRKANPSDVSALVNFNQRMAFETEGKELAAETLTNGVGAVFADERKGFYVVAEDEGALVGGLMVTFEWSDWRNHWFWWIQSVYIVPQARGKGIYRSLYDFVKAEAEMAGNVCGFRLYVERENTKAQSVYEKVGMIQPGYLMYEENV